MIVRKAKLFAASAVAASSVLTSAAYAAYPAIEEPVAVDHSGFYVGGEIGWGNQNSNRGHFFEPYVFDVAGDLINPDTAGNEVRIRNSNNGSVAGRINLGYNFNEFFAVELGGAAWGQSNIRWDVYAPIVDGSFWLASGNGRVNSYDVDLLAKVTYPFANGFKVFAKAGGAYVWTTGELNNNLRVWAPITGRSSNNTNSHLRPEAAAGVGYNIDDNWSVSAQYSYIWGNNNNNNHWRNNNNVPNLQMATVGVQYDIT